MKEIELHQEGLRFVRTVLQGGDYLAQAMLRTLPLDEGSVFTFLPDEVDRDLISLEQGGLSQFDYDDDLKAPLIGLIAHFLQSSPDNMAVIEATSLSPQKLPSWAAHIPAGSQYFTTEGTARKARETEAGMIGVYGFMEAGHADAASLDDFIDEAFPFRQVGALTSAPEGEPPKPGEQVTVEWLGALAARTQHVFMGAYDGSGWVVWSVRGRPSHGIDHDHLDRRTLPFEPQA